MALSVHLSVDQAVVSAAFRAGDSPTNAVTPLDPYFAPVRSKVR
jgi:p-aminobenzoyl-glutamate transporter AbgT